jgi:ABC-type phosphate transport system auxiliary subunit
MNNPQITAKLAARVKARVKTVAEDSSVTSAERATPETDALWADKSRNILDHSQNLELQRDEAREERDTALAQLDVLEQSIADLSHRNMRMLVADLEAERAARKALTKALMICIRYADSSADTEQAHAALALAARLL